MNTANKRSAVVLLCDALHVRRSSRVGQVGIPEAMYLKYKILPKSNNGPRDQRDGDLQTKIDWSTGLHRGEWVSGNRMNYEAPYCSISEMPHSFTAGGYDNESMTCLSCT